MENLTRNIQAIKSAIDTMRERLNLPSNTTIADIISYIPIGGVKSTYLIESVDELDNIEPQINDIAFLWETTYIPATNDSYEGKYYFYMPKVVPEEYMWAMPKVMDGNITLQKTGLLYLKSTGDGVYTFKFNPANVIWENHNIVCVQYEIVNDLFTRTRIYDYETDEDLDNSMDLLFIDSGRATNYTNWNDHVTQFELVPIGNKVTRVYQYNGTIWEIQPYGYTCENDMVSYYGRSSTSVVAPGNSFVGKNGYEIGTLDTRNKFLNKTPNEITASQSTAILNRLQYEIDKIPDSGIYYNNVTKANIVGFPIRSDGTSPIIINNQPVFNSNSRITVVPKGLITNRVTNLTNTFKECKRIYAVGFMDTSNVTSMNTCFYKNYSLEEVPAMDWSKLKTAQNCFQLCHVLNNNSLNNILASCLTVSSQYTGTKSLAYLGLTSWQAQICQTLSNYQDFINAGWITGY